MSSRSGQVFGILQAVARQRCASCARWQGPRTPGPSADSVAIPDERATGTCCGGPWDGAERLARSACGRWLRWTAADNPAVAGEPLEEPDED